MLRKGPIPRLVHGVLQYVVGALLIGSVFVLDYDEGGAKAAAILLGLGFVVLAASSAGPTGLVDQIGTQAQVVLDLVLSGLLVAAPFLFGFSDDGEPTAVCVLLGVGTLLLTIGTRFLPARDA